MALAKEYGKLPSEIENEEPYWLNHMLLYQEAENINLKKEASTKPKTRR